MVEPKGMVFKHKHETNGEVWYSYTYSVSSKNMDGEWESVPKPIQFKKGITPPENKTRIVIKSGWEKPMKWKGEKVPGWFVTGYEVLDDYPKGFTSLSNDDVPF